MAFFRASLHIIFSTTALFTALCAASAPAVRIAQSNAQYGPTTIVDGLIDPATPKVEQYLGIPYAAAPTGSLRWTAPQTAPHSIYVNASKAPPSCFQFVGHRSGSVYTNLVTEFSIPGENSAPMSEDCLTASVWRPVQSSTNASPLPVVIFIHGGAFTGGSETVPYQNPAQWLQRTQNLIVVSFNYRLNVFGFPNSAGLSDQNLGLLDQKFAIQWIHDHISSFGGDPNKIILWGQSAGAMSVDLYNFAYPSQLLVKGFIMDSGTVLFTSLLSNDKNHTNFSNLAAQVGCGNSATPAVELTCMRNVPASKITDLLHTWSDTGRSPGFSFTPIVDEKTVFSDVKSRAQNELIADVPAIIGINAQDGVPFAAFNINGPDQAVVAQAQENTFHCPAVQDSRLRKLGRNNRKTYRYVYAGNFSNISPTSWLGAYHSAELPMLFGTHPNFRGNSTNAEYAVSAAMQDAWYAFISDPVNGLEKTGWQAWTKEAPIVRYFGANGTIASNVVDNEAGCQGYT